MTLIADEHPTFFRSPLVERASQLDALLRAWEIVRSNDEADGDLSLGVLRFSNSVTREIDALHVGLQTGSYRPGGLAEVRIPKSSGGQRLLRIPTVRDRVVERSLLSVLVPAIDPWLSPWSFAYRPGLGVEDALQRLVRARDDGALWVAQADVADCFDTIDHQLLLATLSEWVDAGAVELVSMLLGRKSRKAGTRRWTWTGEGTAQGAPLSPLLANVFLDRLDRTLASSGVSAIRYGDDLTIFGATKADVREQLKVVEQAVGGLGMALNPSKTEVVSFEEGFVFLGAEIGPNDPRVTDEDVVVPERKAIYVTLQGANVFIKKGQLKVVKGEEEHLSVPLSHVGQIVSFGSIGISAGLREAALQKDIEVTLCSRSGSYRGRLDGPGSNRVSIRRAQYRATESRNSSLPLAQALVLGKISNQAALLARYRRRVNDEKIDIAIARLRSAKESVVTAATINQLMGVEGAAAKEYFRAWPSLLPEVIFLGRSYRPPKNVVNAALSFGYSLLTGNAVAAIAAVGLDPSVGVLHAEEDGRPSLALDLMEEFRPLIVDAVVIEMVRRRIFDDSDGVVPPSGSGVWLSSDARGHMLRRLETRFLTEFAHTPSRRRISYRRALYLQARQLVGVFQGVREYEPVRWR